MADENSTANTARRAADKLHSTANNRDGLTKSKQPQPQRAVTAQYDFFDLTVGGSKLFSVNAGIPISDAFDQLSLLLAASQSAMRDVGFAVDDGEVPQSHGAALHLVVFASALVESMHRGLLANRSEA